MSETEKVWPVKGSTVYKVDGTQGTYIEELVTGEHIVSVEFYDTHYYNDEPEVVENITQIWDRVYASAPKAQREERIVRLDTTIIDRQNELSRLYDLIRKHQQDLYNLETQSKVRLANITQHKALANLELFLEGKITHFLKVSDSSYEIVDIESGLDLGDDGKYDSGKFKLLTLYGRTDGDLEWRINQYSDGSGASYLVYPCISYEDAEAKVIEVWHDKLASLKKDDYGLVPICETAKKLGIPLKEDIASWYKEVKRSQIDNQVKSAEQQIDTYEHNVNLLKERLVGLYSEIDEVSK